MRLCAGGLNKY